MTDISSTPDYEIVPVKWWFTLRCWLLHFWRHVLEYDQEGDVSVGVRYCPKCRLVVRVLSSPPSSYPEDSK